MASSPSLLNWLKDPHPSSIFFHQRHGTSDRWRELPQDDLARRVRAATSVLLDVGVKRDAPVLIAVGTAVEFIDAFFGAISAGAIPTPIEPPGPLTSASYREHMRNVITRIRPDVVVGDARLAELIVTGRAGECGPMFVTPAALAAGDPHGALPFGGSYAVGQLTSGTTGAPKIVHLTAQQISDHLAAIWTWLQMGNSDVGVSWLPLHHDMGLVGHLLLPLAMGLYEYLMTPLSFIREPRLWLETLSHERGTITAGPTFGYRYLLEKLGADDLTDLDLSGCRAMIVGAERVDATLLVRLAAKLGNCGFQRAALLPAYGLAEATLAASGNPPGREPHFAVLDPGTAKQIGEPIVIRAQGDLTSLSASPDGVIHMACGPPIPGVRVTVEDEDGETLPVQTLGKIVVEAPWVGTPAMAQPRSASAPQRVDTGDVGFLLDGELYVIGRMGDSMNIRGRRVFATTIEAAVTAESDQQIVVVMGNDSIGPVVVSVIEGRINSDKSQQIASIVGRHVDASARIVLIRTARGSLPRSTSGKPKRPLIWARYVNGFYDGGVLGPVDRTALDTHAHRQSHTRNST